MSALLVSYRNPQELKPHPANSRRHSPAQVRQVARSIKAFGFLSPVLIDENDFIVAGHCRADAAKLNALSSIPTIRVEHLTEAQKRAFIIADSRPESSLGPGPRWSRGAHVAEKSALTAELESS